VPRDRAASFDPQIVRKRQRRLSGVDEIVLSLYAKGVIVPPWAREYVSGQSHSLGPRDPQSGRSI
jgi:transposase-like protein